jgi:hypothetical protein
VWRIFKDIIRWRLQHQPEVQYILLLNSVFERVFLEILFSALGVKDLFYYFWDDMLFAYSKQKFVSNWERCGY